ncbi:MAG: hypothetical protein NC293_07740 [Roseburia sp.]|nr:hypothetical protein [Roseburia sp.]
MKKALYLITIFVLLFSLIGCSNTQSNEISDTENPLLGKIYMHNNFSDTFSFDYVKFYDDNTFQGIEVKGKDNTTNHFGNYKIDKGAVTLNISDESFAGVITGNGSTINFGEDEFIDWTSHISNTDPTLKKFK